MGIALAGDLRQIKRAAIAFSARLMLGACMRDTDDHLAPAGTAAAKAEAQQALQHMERAIAALDRAAVPGHIAAHLQMAIDSLKETSGQAD